MKVETYLPQRVCVCVRVFAPVVESKVGIAEGPGDDNFLTLTVTGNTTWHKTSDRKAVGKQTAQRNHHYHRHHRWRHRQRSGNEQKWSALSEPMAHSTSVSSTAKL